jgi:CshA-type fibril repeat protein
MVLLVATCSLGAVAAPVASASPVSPADVGDPTLTLTSNGAAPASLAANDTLRAVTDAPITLTGQTSQTISQTWDPAQLRLGSSAITAPENWQLEYTTDGTTWSSTVPGDLTAVRGVRTIGDVNALGYSGGLQSSTATADGAVRVPTVSSISVTGAGDGWDVFFDEAYTKIFNVFHHSSPAQIDCHSLFDGSRCAGYPVTMPLSLGTNDRSTGISVGSKVWVAAGRSSNPGGGFACFNVSGGLCSTSFVKLTDNANNGGHSNVGNMARIGQYVFTQNFKDGKVLCLDTQTNAGCSSMPSGGFDLGTGPVQNYPSNLLALGTRLYSHDGYGQVGCLDTTTWGLCADWATVWSSGRTVHLMALPDATGNIVAVCTWDNSGVTCVDETQTSYTAPASLAPLVAANPDAYGGYANTPQTVGSRVYWSDAVWYEVSAISCWDAALNGGAGGQCANFPIAEESYTVVVDPQNADCIWTNDNNGTIESFNVLDGSAGCPVDPDPVVQLPYTAVAPRMACAEAGRVRGWTTFKAVFPAGSVTDLRVTVKRNGLALSGWSNLTPNAQGEIDLSTLTVAQSGTQPVFEVKAVGSTSTDAETITADVTYLSDAPQLCVDLTVLRQCPALSGIAPAGALPIDPVTVDVTVTNAAGASSATSTLTDSSTRADLTGCQGSISGSVLRTPPGGSFPIVGATVTLRDSGGNVVTTATTDANGDYSFPSLYPSGYTVTYNTTDEAVTLTDGGSETRNFSIPVNNPSAENVSGTTPQNVAVIVPIDATADPLTAIDPNTLEIRLPGGSWDTTVTVPGEGVWFVDADALRFVPDVAFHGAATAIEYQVQDGYANYADALASVTVTESALAASPDTATGTQGQTLHLDASADAGAVAVDYTTVELSTTEAGTFAGTLSVDGVGTFTPDASGHVTFVPAGTFSGTRTVYYRVQDAAGRWATSSFTVSLTAVALGGSTDIVPPATNGSLPVTGIPSGAAVSVPSSVANAKSLSFSNGSVFIEPTDGFSGIIRVPVTATLGTATFTTEVVLTVLPKAPTSLRVTNSPYGAIFTWPASTTTNATGYVVRVNGFTICTVTPANRACGYPGLIGSRATVEVQTLGADGTVSGWTKAAYAPSRCQKVASVHFATDSARLTDAAKRTLRSVAASMRTQRFDGYCLSGHTDSRGSIISNDSLSYFRARNVAAYLNKYLPSSMRLRVAYSGEYRPVASNDTKAGMSANRRVDISVR